MDIVEFEENLFVISDVKVWFLYLYEDFEVWGFICEKFVFLILS